MRKSRLDWAKWIPILIIAIVLMIIYKTFDNFTQITTAISNFIRVISPLLLGILFTYFLYAPHRGLEKLLSKVKIKKFTFIASKARVISTIIIFILVLVAIAAIAAIVIPIIFENIADLASAIPGYWASMIRYFDNLPSDSIFAELNIAGLLRDNYNVILSTVVNLDGIGQVGGAVISFASGVFSGLFSFLLGLVISLYLLLDKGRISGFFSRLNNAVFKEEEKRDRAVKYMRQINKVLFTFIASRGLDCLINFVVVTAILLIFQVPYAVLLGLIAGLFNFIPYIGSIIATVVIGLLTLIACDLPTAIKVLICLLVFQQIDGNYIGPRIMKSSLDISPILVIMAVVIGGAYFGIVGMFLAVPIAAIIKQILHEYILSVEARKSIIEAGTENDMAIPPDDDSRR